MVIKIKNVIRSIPSSLKRLFHYPKLVLEETNYDDYWANKLGSNMGYANEWQKQRGDWIVSCIEEGSTVLDIGCGDGGVLLYINLKKSLMQLGMIFQIFVLIF